LLREFSVQLWEERTYADCALQLVLVSTCSSE
jgi:hypothetical protein